MLRKLVLRVGLGLALAAGSGMASGSVAVQAEPSVPADAGDLDLSFGGFGASGRLVGAQFPGTQMFDSATLLDGSAIVAGTDGLDFIVVHALTNGQLDPDFGVAGVARLDFGASDSANSVALDEDGRILVAGTTSTGGISGTSNFAVARLNSDGSPDNSFDTDGKVTVDFHGKRDSAQFILPYTYSTVVHAIIVAGSAEDSSGSTANMAFVRLDSVGGLDGGFGAGGKAETALAGNEVATAVVTDTSGSLYAGGFQTSPGAFFVMTSMAYNGNPNNTFGTASILTGITLTTLLDLAWLDYPDGTLVATGAAGSDVGIMAVNNTGGPMMTFGTDGLATVDFGGATDVPKALLPARDATLAVAGSSGTRLGLARFSEDGDLLPGSPALTNLAAQGASEASAIGLSLVSDIRLMTWGSIQAGVDRRLALTRHFIDMSPDAGGRQGTDFGNTTGDSNNSNNSDVPRTAVFQPDGKLIVGGSSDPAGSGQIAVLTRYTTDGQRDPTFGNANTGLVYQPALTETIGVAVLPFGQLIIGDVDFNLMRLDSAGDQDFSFGTGGIARANYPGARAGALVRQADGKLVLAGLHRTPQQVSSVALARFTAAGQLDPGYGLGGRVITGVGPYSAGLDAALTPDGKVVVAGVTGVALNQDLTLNFLVIRYNSDGTPDDSFGNDGVVITDFGAGELATAVAVMSDGRIVVGGNSTTSGMAFARYLPTGQPDNSFSFDGKRLLQLMGHDFLTDLVLQGDRIVATDCDGIAKANLVIRLTGSGGLDTSFNGSGHAPFGFTGDDCAGSLALTPGRIAAAGTARGVGYTYDFAVAMYESPIFPLFLPLVVR